MKLFTRKEATSTFNVKQSLDISQIAYLEKTLSDLQKRINVETDQFNLRMKDMRAVYGEEKEKLQEQIRVLQGELKILNEQRNKLLIPFGNLKQKATKMLADAQLQILGLEAKEHEAEEALILYQEKLDSLSSRETDIETKEQSLWARIKATEDEAKQVSEGHERLNKMIAEVNEKMSTQVKATAEKESAILLREQSFEVYKKNIESELAKERTFIEHQRASLNRGFEELQKLKTKYK